MRFLDDSAMSVSEIEVDEAEGDEGPHHCHTGHGHVQPNIELKQNFFDDGAILWDFIITPWPNDGTEFRVIVPTFKFIVIRTADPCEVVFFLIVKPHNAVLFILQLFNLGPSNTISRFFIKSHRSL